VDVREVATTSSFQPVDPPGFTPRLGSGFRPKTDGGEA
jgi:hypothetical protein